MFLPINRDRKPLVTLANGQPAWTRNRRVTQSMINEHGSRAAALAAMGRGL